MSDFFKFIVFVVIMAAFSSVAVGLFSGSDSEALVEECKVYSSTRMAQIGEVPDKCVDYYKDLAEKASKDSE